MAVSKTRMLELVKAFDAPAVALTEAGRRLRGGESIERVEATGLGALERAGFGKIDYFEARGADDLARLGPGPVDGDARVLAAAHLGKTRVIDNVAV